MLCKVHKVDKGERFNDVMYNKWVWLGSQKVLRFKCFLVFIWDAPCMNWTFASRVGDLRSYPIIYSTYNKIELSSKLVRNYAIIQPTIPYDKFSMSNWPSMRGAYMDVHRRPAGPVHDDWETILLKDNLAHDIPFSS